MKSSEKHLKASILHCYMKKASGSHCKGWCEYAVSAVRRGRKSHGGSQYLVPLSPPCSSRVYQQVLSTVLFEDRDYAQHCKKRNPKLSKVISKREYLYQWSSLNLDVKSKLKEFRTLLLPWNWCTEENANYFTASKNFFESDKLSN